MREAAEVVIQALAVTCELTQTELSKAAIRVMAHDLSKFPAEQVLGALTRCRKELRGRLTTADVISRLEDGRPGPEEAWAMIPRDEAASVVWTEEMRQAWSIARPLILEGDVVPARMAFLEAYRRLCLDAREAAAAVAWTPSLGWDPMGRERTLLDAVEKKRLPHAQAAALLPAGAFKDASAQTQALLARAALPAPSSTEDKPRRMLDLLKPLKRMPTQDA